MSITLIIVIVTVAVSILALRERRWFDTLMLSPYRVVHDKQWYRIITHGFIHADYIHLAVNMIVLYSFGEAVEVMFGMVSNLWILHFLVLYFFGMVAASITTIAKHKDNYSYASVGASGAVSAVLFAFIFMQPWEKLWIMGILPVPGIIFGPLYLWYSSYMGKRGGDNVNHDAHMYGALFGFLYPMLVEPGLLRHFIDSLLFR